MEEMQVLKGKNNYQCILDIEYTCEDCILSAGKKCSVKDNCNYYKTEKWAIDSQTAILNYNMLHVFDKKLYNSCFDDTTMKIDKFKYEHKFKRDLMIVDEAHGTEGFLMNLISVSLKILSDDMKFSYLSNSPDLSQVKSLLSENLIDLRVKANEIKCQVEQSLNDSGVAKLGKKYNAILNKIEKLEYVEITIDNGIGRLYAILELMKKHKENIVTLYNVNLFLLEILQNL